MSSNEMQTESVRYTNSELEQKELNNQFVRYVNPLVFNDSIFLVNEYIHEYDGTPLTVSQCKYIRQNILNELYGDVFRELVYNMPDDLDTDMEGRVNRFMGEMMDRLFVRDGKEGVLETYLRDNRLLPEEADSSLTEYADKNNFTITEMNKKLDSMKQKKICVHWMFLASINLQDRKCRLPTLQSHRHTLKRMRINRKLFLICQMKTRNNMSLSPCRGSIFSLERIR